MDTLEDIKTYIADMVVYCDVIDSNSTIKSKIAFVQLMGLVAKRIANKCDKLEKELEHEKEKAETQNQKAEEKD